MKIIFLDIDGVLNLRNRSRDRFGQKFHTRWVNNLFRIVEETKAKIIISSTWRHVGIEKMKELWEFRNLPGEVINITPSFRGVGKNFQYSIPRGCEIEYLLEEMGFHRINWSKEEFIKRLENSPIKNYVILDDDSDMLYSQYEHFVRTSRNFNHKTHIEGFGLTDECANKAIEILNTPIEHLYYER